MAKSQSVGARLAALDVFRGNADSDDARDTLRKGLADRSNYVIERAAQIVGESELQSLLPDLLKAFERLLTDPLKKDKGCAGKTAIAKTLVQLGYDDPEFYRKGIAYTQTEPLWPREKDTASKLRGICAVGLIGSTTSLEVLNRCAELLADPELEARSAAARAIGTLGLREGAPLLRLKILTGDASAEVIGECCAALLRTGDREDIDFIVRLVSSGQTDICVQAAFALGAARKAGAFEPIRRAWERQLDPAVRGDLLLCIGLLRTPEANEFLLSLITPDDLRIAADAIAALKVHGDTGDMRQKVKAVLDTAAARRLDCIFEKEWSPASPHQ